MLSKHRTAAKIFSLCQSAASNNEFAILKQTGIVQRYAGKDHHARSIHRRGLSSISSGKGGEAIVLESDYGPVTSPKLNLPQFLWKDVEKWGDKPMVTCGVSGRSYTFKACRHASRLFGTALRTQFNLQKGDVLGLLLPNLPEYPIAIHGAIEAGIVTTFVNPLYTPDEVHRQFEDAGVKCCVTIAELLPVIEQIGPRLKNFNNVIVIGAKNAKISTSSNLKVHDFQEVISSQSSSNIDPAKPDDIAVLPYSSGTTGLPKGVMLTHENCVINIEQLTHPKLTGWSPTTDSFQEIELSVLPFFHIYGFNIILNMSILNGLHLITLPKFTPEAYIQCLIKYKPTQLFVVPSMLLFLSSHPSVKPEYLKSVKEIVSGAASATKSLIENFKLKFNHDGLIVRQGYGMTELSPCALFIPLDAKCDKEGSAGKLVKGTSARIVNLTTGHDQPTFQSGELYIKGPQIMKGYWKNDKATNETINSEGWLQTGDIAYYDDSGYFYIIDRTKELIKVKGNQVSPTELENLILQLPQIADVAVVGVPDMLADEVPRAFVVVKQGTKITEEEITNYVKQKVVNYKQLAGGVSFIDAVPRNMAGKILRKELLVLHRAKEHC